MENSVKSPLSDKELSFPAWSIVALSVIQLIGVYVSDLLTFESIGLKLGDKTDSGLCGMSETFSCKAAAAAASHGHGPCSPSSATSPPCGRKRDTE